MTMRVLITGGAGFTGSILAEELVSRGHQVTVFDALRVGDFAALSLLRRQVRVVKGDVTRLDQLRPEVARHDAVIHLAAVVGYPACDAQPEIARAINVGGTRNVVDCLSPAQILIYASTGSVYGRVSELCTEAHEPSPLTLYGRTKLEAERIAVSAGAIALRFATIVGVSPCMRFDVMLNAFVYWAVKAGWMVCYEPGARRTLLDVTDAARAYALALERSGAMAGEVFNVGNPAMNITKRQVLDEIRAQFPMRVVYDDVGEDPDRRDYAVSFEKFEAHGFRAQVTLRECVAAVGAAAKLVDGGGLWRVPV